jgi:hypothetical protein
VVTQWRRDGQGSLLDQTVRINPFLTSYAALYGTGKLPRAHHHAGESLAILTCSASNRWQSSKSLIGLADENRGESKKLEA